MKTAKKLIDSIKVEDKLPSEAGIAFRNLIAGWQTPKDNPNPKYILGYRELDIVADWLKYFCNMPAKERDAFVEYLDHE